jgi:hypothetical protein
MASLMVAGVGAANAATTDPTNGAGTAIFDDMKAYLTGNLIPAFFGLLIVGIIVGLVVAWVKRARKS